MARVNVSELNGYVPPAPPKGRVKLKITKCGLNDTGDSINPMFDIIDGQPAEDGTPVIGQSLSDFITIDIAKAEKTHKDRGAFAKRRLAEFAAAFGFDATDFDTDELVSAEGWAVVGPKTDKNGVERTKVSSYLKG